MLHQMRLQPNPFEKIKSGTKTIEIRLNDEKRQQVKIDDEVEFSLLSDDSQKIKAKIIDLYKYQTFSELFEAHPAEDFGAVNKDDLLSIYKYYTKEEESKYGVLGIKIEVTK
jgi:ASC-1-like (ASCH) protein